MVFMLIVGQKKNLNFFSVCNKIEQVQIYMTIFAGGQPRNIYLKNLKGLFSRGLKKKIYKKHVIIMIIKSNSFWDNLYL